MDRIWDKSKPPQGPFDLNVDCLQAQSLVLWMPFVTNSNALRNEQFTRTNSPVYTLSDVGAPAVRLVRSSSQYLNRAAAVVTNVPLSMAARFISYDDTNAQDIVSIGTSGVAGRDRFQLIAANNVTNNPVRATTANTSVATAADTGTYTVGTWAHAGATFTSSTSRRAFFNGVAGSSNTTSCVVTTNNATTIGAVWFDNALTNFFDGAIADVMIWNATVRPEVMQRLADKGTAYEHWYPLRSRKWISIGTSLPTLSSPTYAAGSLTSSGWIPQVTAT